MFQKINRERGGGGGGVEVIESKIDRCEKIKM